MSMQSVASPAYSFTPPRRNSLTHIPGDEGWPLIGKTLEVLADPKGQVERQSKKYGLVYRSHLFGETSLVLLGPEANELVLFDQAKQFSSTLGWGRDSRAAVSARADAARFRGASPAPPRAVGGVQVRADEVLSCRSRYRHRRAGGAMEGAAGTDAVLSRDEAADARPRGDLVSRRRHRARSRRDHPRLRRHGGGLRRRDPKAAARHADGARRQGPQAHRRLFLRADPDPPRQRRRRRSVLAAVPRDPRGRRAALDAGHRRSHEFPDDGGARHADLVADVVRGRTRRPSGVAAEAARRSHRPRHRRGRAHERSTISKPCGSPKWPSRKRCG